MRCFLDLDDVDFLLLEDADDFVEDLVDFLLFVEDVLEVALVVVLVDVVEEEDVVLVVAAVVDEALDLVVVGCVTPLGSSFPRDGGVMRILAFDDDDDDDGAAAAGEGVVVVVDDGGGGDLDLFNDSLSVVFFLGLDKEEEESLDVLGVVVDELPPPVVGVLDGLSFNLALLLLFPLPPLALVEEDGVAVVLLTVGDLVESLSRSVGFFFLVVVVVVDDDDVVGLLFLVEALSSSVFFLTSFFFSRLVSLIISLASLTIKLVSFRSL